MSSCLYQVGILLFKLVAQYMSEMLWAEEPSMSAVKGCPTLHVMGR